MPQPASLNRRTTLALLGAASLPLSARADDAPAIAPPPAAIPTPAPTPAPPRPPPAPTAAIDSSKRYLVFFDQGIDIASMRALRHQLSTLVEAGVQDIEIVMHSAGGLLDPMFVTYSFIRALPARITMHAQGSVMSAAATLFLAGDDRSADRNALFLFHPSTFPFTGILSSQQTQDRLTQFGAVAGVSDTIFRDRTTLSDAEIARFGREEVIYTAEQALAAGVIQHIRDLRIPGPDKARLVFLD